MQPLQDVIHVDAPLRDARTRFKMCDQPCLVVVNGDEVVGLLPRDRVVADGASKQSTGVGISDLMQLPTAPCRPADSVSSVRKLLDNMGRDTALVLGHDNQLLGLFGAQDGSVSGGDGREEDAHRHTGDALGGRVHDGPFGELKVYTQRPHLDRTRLR